MLIGLEEAEYQTVAETTGVPVGTVRSRLARGRKNLRMGGVSPRRSADPRLERCEGPMWGDTVEEVGFEVIGASRLPRRGTPVIGASPQVAEVGVGTGISLASLRRFWAVAARWNSSRAPFGPRNRSRSSFRMRLRWANSISTFLR
jgi:hypothetical protein